MPDKPHGEVTKTPNGEVASARLLNVVLIALSVVVAAVVLISIFVPDAKQIAAFSVIEKLAVPIFAGLMILIHQKLTKVEHIVNSKSEKQDAKIAELEKQVMSGRQDKRDAAQDEREAQQLARSKELDEKTADITTAKVLVVKADAPEEKK